MDTVQGPCQSEHSSHTELTSNRLSESGVLTKRDMQNMQSGGARGLELRTAAIMAP